LTQLGAELTLVGTEGDGLVEQFHRHRHRRRRVPALVLEHPEKVQRLGILRLPFQGEPVEAFRLGEPVRLVVPLGLAEEGGVRRVRSVVRFPCVVHYPGARIFPSPATPGEG
jgi:hypothetical protein